MNGCACRGWDYLQRKLIEQLAERPELLDPGEWATWSQERLEQIYDDSQAGRTLSDPGRRAELIRDLGIVMNQNSWMHLSDLYDLAECRVATGSPHILGLLQQFEAYRDPVRKKSLFLLGLMRNSEGWKYADEAEIGPPVDYHEVRGHLRIGTVKVKSLVLREKIQSQQGVTEQEDVAIRSAVYAAIAHVARMLDRQKVDPMVLHYLFWNVFRTVCHRPGRYWMGGGRAGADDPGPQDLGDDNELGRHHQPSPTLTENQPTPLWRQRRKTS